MMFEKRGKKIFSINKMKPFRLLIIYCVIFVTGGVQYDSCRVVSVVYEKHNANRETEGYEYKYTAKQKNYVRGKTDACKVVSQEYFQTHKYNLNFPTIIKGTTIFNASTSFDFNSLQTIHKDKVFHALKDQSYTLQDILSANGGYYSGQLGKFSDCYSEKKQTNDLYSGTSKTLNGYERQYSPFVSFVLDKLTIPNYLKPLRIAYMGIGLEEGSGVPTEEHPSGWFITIDGKKRWIFHPPSINGPPQNVFERNDNNNICKLLKEYEESVMCDTQEGDIVWIPSGWWHETCSLTKTTVGLGGISFENAGRLPDNRGPCNLGHNSTFNAEMNERTGAYSIEEISYCKENKCSTL